METVTAIRLRRPRRRRRRWYIRKRKMASSTRTKNRTIKFARRHVETEDDPGTASTDKDSSDASSKLTISLLLQEEIVKAAGKPPTVKSAARRKSNKGTHGKPRSDRHPIVRFITIPDGLSLTFDVKDTA
ncbi:uncharacterized protein LOC113463827 [Ceratina calcarata]|uniref:Uncharacterized protein LOC113463827 n=1 Tax=Ceratina calcarata TaxID=156304 RepID=A0AAJ7RWB3_9HYME|nr:uncharacterized protein LOC113463827 [Ceratina calcarata]